MGHQPLQNVQIATMPQSIEDFLQLQKTIATTPQGGAVMLILAMMAYINDNTFGLECLTVSVIEDSLMQGQHGYQGWQIGASQLQLLKSQLRDKAYIIPSYVQGTSPGEKYTLPALPWTYKCSSNPYSGDPENGPFKVFVESSGADSPRPITLKPNDDNLWKAVEWSSIIVGVRPPPKDKPRFG